MKERFDDSNENITLLVSHNSDTAFLYWFFKEKPTQKNDFRIKITPTDTTTTTPPTHTGTTTSVKDPSRYIDVGSDDNTYFYKKNIVLKENCNIKITHTNGVSNTIKILIKEKPTNNNNKHIDTYYQCLPDGSYGIAADCISKDKFPNLDFSQFFNELKNKVNTLLIKNIILQ